MKFSDHKRCLHLLLALTHEDVTSATDTLPTNLETLIGMQTLKTKHKVSLLLMRLMDVKSRYNF
jgi:hypothetical protein